MLGVVRRVFGCVQCLLVEEWNRGVDRRRAQDAKERWLEWDVELVLEEEEFEKWKEERFKRREEEEGGGEKEEEVVRAER